VDPKSSARPKRLLGAVRYPNFSRHPSTPVSEARASAPRRTNALDPFPRPGRGFTPPYEISYRGVKLPRVSAALGALLPAVQGRFAAGGPPAAISVLYITAAGSKLPGMVINSVRRWVAALWAAGRRSIRGRYSQRRTRER
jgi:hypothetical protein